MELYGTVFSGYYIVNFTAYSLLYNVHYIILHADEELDN